MAAHSIIVIQYKSWVGNYLSSYLHCEDAQWELPFPRSNEEADEFYQERKPFLLSIGTGQNTGYIFGDKVDNGSWNSLTQRGKGHVSLSVAPHFGFTALTQCEHSKTCASIKSLNLHGSEILCYIQEVVSTFLEDEANVFCLIHSSSNIGERAAEDLMCCIFLNFQLKVSFGKEIG